MVRVEEGRRLTKRPVGEVNHSVIPLGKRGLVASARPAPGDQPLQQIAVGDKAVGDCSDGRSGLSVSGAHPSVRIRPWAWP